MLVLSRYPDEEVVLVLEDGREITLMPVAIQGGKVRLGIAAPRSIQVHRREVLNAIRRRQAGESNPPVATHQP